MDPGAASTVRRNFARDREGRELFLPWVPFSRNAYVVPDPTRRAVLVRRMEFYVVFWLGVLAGAFAAGLLDSWRWSSLLFAGAALAHWAWWMHRSTRGLERARPEAR